MNGREIFKIWAPFGEKWVDWVRPVPFIEMKKSIKIYENLAFNFRKINYIDSISKDTAIIVDLPGNESIIEGIALAKLGFRPIPVFNGTIQQEGAMPTVDNQAITLGLIKGAEELKKINIDKDALPVFLLDSNRMNRYKMNESIFDNSWDIYHQDLPSCKFFLKNNITNILIRGYKVNEDLNKILYKFQKQGIKIFLANKYDEVKLVKLKKISDK